jgi:sugar O-acyltransferase (sialic acid O-acetyltransferase NeuD family)
LKHCAILGAGGHAKVAIAALRAAGWTVDAAYDDDRARLGERLLEVAVKGDVAAALAGRLPLHIAIGSNRARQTIVQKGGGAGWVSAIHPNAQIDPTAVIGEGALVCMGALVQVDARIGRHVIVNTGAIVEHDCLIDDFVHLAPGSKLAGAVEVGEGAMIGIGAQVLPGLKIGAWATVGAGAVVTRSIGESQTVAGCPAGPLR